jgi:hypothetical protein
MLSGSASRSLRATLSSRSAHVLGPANEALAMYDKVRETSETLRNK